MDSETRSFALESALTEMGNACPDIKNSFMFSEGGEIVARDERTSDSAATRVINAFDSISEKADAIGGVKGIALESSKGLVRISCVNDLYLVTVTSMEADMNYVNTVTRVLIPTVIKLLEKITPAPLKNRSTPREIERETPTVEEIRRKGGEDFDEPATEEPPEDEPEEASEPEAEPEAKPEPTHFETPANQFMVENLGGLLVPSDTVRIDGATLQQWEELGDGKRVEQVEIETFGGKSAPCKVKPMNDPKYEGKGIIRMPEKIQNLLEIKKGELVRVKPFLE